ncbi:MAG: class B sortase [Erysipelotrichaceae bacterium]|nr:class B sortase [Erysipelotrichaceae bacterium]
MTKTRKYITVLLILAIILIPAGLYAYNIYRFSSGDADIPSEPIEEPVTVELSQDQLMWWDNYDINQDYVGQVRFVSGLIDQSFVQAKSVYREDGTAYVFYDENGNVINNVDDYTGNDVYIWTNWKSGEYDYNDEGGSVFLDYRNTLDDQNLIIYGHHFSVWNDESRSKSFTPLEQLLDETNLKDNNVLELILEDEKRTYELWAAYEMDFTSQNDLDNLQYWRTYYDISFNGDKEEGYYQKYINNVETVRLYDTGVNLSTEDKTLTLQTCISGYTGIKYEIVVLRFVNSEKWLTY